MFIHVISLPETAQLKCYVDHQADLSSTSTPTVRSKSPLKSSS